MDKRLKIGVMGLVRGDFALKGCLAFSDRAVVTAVCEKNEKQVEATRHLFAPETKVYTDFDEFINSGLDAVVLCNYFDEHVPYAIKAMKAGVAVMSETIAAASLGECIDLVEAYERTGVKYMLGANCPYFKAVHAMKDKIANKEYGRVMYADAEYIHSSVPGADLKPPVDLDNLHWRQTLPCCYYNMHSLGPLMYITESVPVKVLGKGVRMDSPGAKKVSDMRKSFCITEMDNGAVFNTTGVVNGGTISKWFRVACETGTMETMRNDWREEILLESGVAENEFKKTLPPWPLLTPEESKKYGHMVDGVGHGGIDAILMLDFIKFLEGEKEIFFDVYRSAALAAAGILTWYSILDGSKEYEIPDFHDKKAREIFRGDYRKPFAKSYKDLTLQCRINPDDLEEMINIQK